MFAPAWLDTDKTLSTLSKHPKCDSREFAQDKFAEKIEKNYREHRYKVAFKEVQRVLRNNRSTTLGHTQKGKGICATIAMVQKEYLPSPNDKKIGKWAIKDAMRRAADAGDVVSPLKRGPKVRIHNDLTYALATHLTMMQVVSNGEAKASEMKAIALAVVTGMHHEGKMSIDYVWHKTRESHPEIMNLVKAKNHENCRVDWLSY